MKTQKKFVGIDISKEYFDVAIPVEKGYEYHQLSNDYPGFAVLAELLTGGQWVVMEASGPYYLKLALYLHENHIPVSVVNPLVIRRFCQMRMVRAKTDKKDAQMIAEYGKTEQPQAWQPEQSYVSELKQIQTVLNQLTKTRTALERQLESFYLNPVVSGEAIKSIQEMLAIIGQEEVNLEKKTQEIIASEHGELYQRLLSIPGIGKKTALLLIVASGGFTRFNSSKQFISYLGLCPRIYTSGKSIRGKSKITKMGMPQVRAALYMCTRSARHCNIACKQLYDRMLEKGKPIRVANIAVANKLVRQAFAIAVNKKYYNAA